jgi:hypothetical protein
MAPRTWRGVAAGPTSGILGTTRLTIAIRSFSNLNAT